MEKTQNAPTESVNRSANKEEESLKENEETSLQALPQTLPEEKNWDGTRLYFYDGFWVPSIALKAITSFQAHFKAHDDDIILASTPKSGTTWLKALLFLITNRSRCATLQDSPLLTSGPHALVPFTEFDLYLKNSCPDLEDRQRPRIFATHTPYAALPASLRESKCKIVYVCRNPMDQLISHWHFTSKLRRENVEVLPVEEAFEMFCKGIHSFGPFCDHVLGFWKASEETPERVLFLTYEDLKEDTVSYTKKLAEFVGYPFSEEEEKKGTAEEITKLCSFETMKELEVHKSGRRPSGAPNSAFFRKGEVGDWENHLTPAMAERLGRLIQEKLDHCGLAFSLKTGKIQKN